MANGTDEAILQGRAPSEEDDFYIEWARETIKRNTSLVNDLLAKMVVLTTALIGAGIGVFDKVAIAPMFRIAVLLLMLGSLTASLWGLYPYIGQVDVRVIEFIKLHKEYANRVKLFRLALPACCSSADSQWLFSA